MKVLNQLWVIEADEALTPLYSTHELLLSAFSKMPVAVQTAKDFSRQSLVAAPELVLLHSNLASVMRLQEFVQLQTLMPYSSVVIVGAGHDEELCMLALEAGADDVVEAQNLTPAYLHKTVLLARRRHQTEKQLKNSREQLLACIENTPNVAVQWYNADAVVLFWNKASERFFGHTAEEAVGKTVDELIAMPENKKFWQDKMQRMAASGTAGLTKEWRFVHRSGEERHCLSTLFRIPSFNGEPWFACMDVDVTLLKQTEARLRESEERYESLFNQASDAIFINDTEGRYLDMNKKACELAGFTKEELLKRGIADLHSAEELERHPIMWPQLLRGERTIIERNLLRADGTQVPVEVTAQMLTDGRIMAIVRDVSERKKIEEELKQTSEKYRSLIEQQGDAIALFDKENRILDVNTSATQLLQYSREEFQQMTLSGILATEEAVENLMDLAALGTGEAAIWQRRLRRKDGTPVETEMHAKHLFDGLFLASIRDLSKRLEVQQRLEKEIELSDSIINSLPGLFYLYQPGVGYLRWNKQLQKTTGYSAAEIRRLTPVDFFDEDEKPLIRRAVEKVFELGENAVEANLLTKDKRKIPYYFTGRYIYFDGRPAFLGTGMDLSEVKKLQRQLATQKAVAQRKLMQAMIAAEEKERNKLGLELHDNVNQILSVVRMYLSLLNDGEHLEEVTLPKAMQLLNDAIVEIRRLSHSLAISYKFETGLSGSLEEMVDTVKAGKDFAIELQLPTGLDKHTNGEQKLAVYRIVQEALNNIIKYAKATEVVIRLVLTAQNLELEIADNGQGFQLSKPAKGLGLSNIANRAEALGGWVKIDTAPGEGCRVFVTLPLKGREV